ncbi:MULTISPECIES: hypothetical protein [unclassified Rummeliibacillus]|nr:MULTISPECIES: hypothetical protein [unclassified Rummeliibacillus]
MASFIATVVGFFGILLVSGAMFVHYLREGLDSSSANIVDPKPKTKF